MSPPFVHELRVRYGECDPQGIVFNANYLLYCDVLITELWRAAVGAWDAMVQRGVDVVLGAVELRFRGAARFDDVLALEATITALGRTSITTEVAVRRRDELLTEATMRHVCVDAATYAKTELPPWLRDGLRPFAVG